MRCDRAHAVRARLALITGPVTDIRANKTHLEDGPESLRIRCRKSSAISWQRRWNREVWS